jgi:hypothetical protein
MFVDKSAMRSRFPAIFRTARLWETLAADFDDERRDRDGG